MMLDWQFLVLLVISVLITGISKSGFAGGVGVIAVPLLSLKTSPVNAAALMLPLLVVMDAFSLKAWWRKRKSNILATLFPAAMLGVLVGYLTFGRFSEDLIKVLLGLLSILFGVWGVVQPRLSHAQWPNWVGGACGGVAGLTSFIAHAGAPPLNVYLLQQNLSKEEFLATAVVFLASINLVKLIPYSLIGMLSFDTMVPALLVMPVAWLGVRIGLKIQGQLDGQLFFRIILIMLILLGVRLVVDGSGMV